MTGLILISTLLKALISLLKYNNTVLVELANLSAISRGCCLHRRSPSLLDPGLLVRTRDTSPSALRQHRSTYTILTEMSHYSLLANQTVFLTTHCVVSLFANSDPSGVNTNTTIVISTGVERAAFSTVSTLTRVPKTHPSIYRCTQLECIASECILRRWWLVSRCKC